MLVAQPPVVTCVAASADKTEEKPSRRCSSHLCLGRGPGRGQRIPCARQHGPRALQRRPRGREAAPLLVSGARRSLIFRSLLRVRLLRLLPARAHA